MTAPGPYAIGPDGNPLMPSSVQHSSGLLTPPGMPIVPPGLLLPRPLDEGGMGMGMMGGGIVPGMVPQIGGDPAFQAIIQQQIYSGYYDRTHRAMAGGGIEHSFRELRDSLTEIAETVRDAAHEISAAMRGGGGGGGGYLPHPVDAPESTGTGWPGARASGPPVRQHHRHRPGQPAAQGGLPPLASVPAKMAFHSFSVEEVMRRAAGAGARALGDNPGGWQRDEEGRWTRQFYGRTEVAGPARTAMLERSSNLSTALGQVAQGGAIGAALPGIARYAGPVAFGAAAVYGGVRALESQRYANLAYQQVTGGPNFSLTDPSSGFRQRVGETVFRAGQIGVMNGGDARMLYLGATATGLQGGERQGALDFATQQFRKVGMDVADSLNLIQMSVRSGVTEFGTLSEALDGVSKRARETGQNVRSAEQAFGATFGAVQQNVTGTAAAATIAGGIQEQIVKQGRVLGDKIDVTGMLSQSSMMMQAASLGQSPMAYMAGVQNNPALLGQGLQTQVNRIRDAVFGPDALQWANGQAKQKMALTGGQLTSSDAAEIGREMAERGMLNPMQFLQVAQTLGIAGVTPANVYEVAAKIAVGGFRFDKSLDKGPSGNLEGGGRNVGGKPIARVGDHADPKLVGSQSRGIAQAILGKDAYVNDLSKAGQSYLTHLHGHADAHGKVTDPGTGQRSALLESLLKDEKSFKGKHFTVQTKDGPKSVNFEQAFKYYQDQLVRGEVQIEETGQTVAEATGQMGDTSASATSAGLPARKGARDPKAPQGSITIYADDELRRILRITTTGGLTLESARRQGVPAAAFPATPSDYPTATGD